MEPKTLYHSEVWAPDGTILSQHDSSAGFLPLKLDEQVIFDRIYHVRDFLDSSHKENGTVYFRRVIRLR